MIEKLNIIYKGCNIVDPTQTRSGNQRPEGFSKIKCFDSLHKSINKHNNVGEIVIIIDGESGELDEHIKNLGYNIKYVNYRSGPKTLEYSYDYATTLNGDFYFVEDDYMHTENAIFIIDEGVKKFGLVTGYDHIDRYILTDDLTYGKEMIQLTNSCHWRTAESTTCTWATSGELYKKIYQMAKTELFNDRNFFRRLILEKNTRLWTPIPAVSTHMANCCLSPFFNV